MCFYKAIYLELGVNPKMNSALRVKAKISVSILKIHLHNKDGKERKLGTGRIKSNLHRFRNHLEKLEAALQFMAIAQPAVKS